MAMPCRHVETLQSLNEGINVLDVASAPRMKLGLVSGRQIPRLELLQEQGFELFLSPRLKRCLLNVSQRCAP